MLLKSKTCEVVKHLPSVRRRNGDTLRPKTFFYGPINQFGFGEALKGLVERGIDYFSGQKLPGELAPESCSSHGLDAGSVRCITLSEPGVAKIPLIFEQVDAAIYPGPGAKLRGEAAAQLFF